jgi:hypothetical protein
MSRRLAVTTACALVLAAAACSKNPPAASGIRLEQVNEALKGAGFQLDNFQRVDGARYAAATCATGPVGGVDTLVCEYASPDAAGSGLRAAEQWVGESVTGSVLTNGLTLLAVADRGHADPNGKTIHKITSTYSKLH